MTRIYVAPYTCIVPAFIDLRRYAQTGIAVQLVDLL
jgi:hypothetical protein